MPSEYHQNTDDEISLNELTDYLCAHIGEWYESNAKLLYRQPEVRSYPSSFFLRYTLSTTGDSNKNLLIKIRRRPYMETIAQTKTIDGLHENMPLEYESLKAVYEAVDTASGTIGAIRPLGYFQPLNAIIMEEISAVTMGKLLLNFGKKTAKKDENFNLILDVAHKNGQWLHFFHHRVHESQEIHFSSKKFMQEVNQLTSHIGSNKNSIISRYLNNIFSATSDKFENSQLHFSITHGDMTVDNILYKDRKVYSIDIKSKPAATYSDIGLILVHPETFIPQVLSFGLFIPGKFIQKYQAAIIEGYFGDAEKDYAKIYLYCALHLLDKWAMYEDIFSSRKNLKRLIALLLDPIFKLYFFYKIKSYLAKAKLQQK